ncbi:phenylacetate--CoA ligase [Paramagnetospirillum caucaseum]|uniref:Phenylacetate-coenzyme A ligase n=1 Tax=Paramagnetospirillum caucaseum TaxID=1244869 RepID=M2Y626_9PROT|nr:phenylacetate--CoA ligase [Paramagnetospirillum caucaseum]EME68516.1 phenylacetate--CoA ligase [Paramagnetospirillum caucaseum]
MSVITRAASAAMFDPVRETMSRDELQALQLRRLVWSLGHACDKVDHHRRAFAAKGIRPADIGRLDDLRHVPFTTKLDLRDNYPYGLLAVPREGLSRLHASSGTTGKPTVVGYTRADLETWAELGARTLAACGARPGDLVHNAYGYGLFTGGLGFHYGAERLGCTVIPMSGGNTEKQIAMIADLGATVLACTPSYALNIAEQAEKDGVDLAGGPLRLAVFGAEPWSEGIRSDIDRRLGVRAQDTYGLSEIMGPGVGAECPERNGLHGWEDHFLFEIIDPETLEPLPPGTAGELVITTLTKQALPMVRYRTRDITRLMTGPCGCGRTHARLERITGRSDDMLIIRGVNVYPSQVESVLLGRDGIVPHYQLVVRRDGAMDHLTVEVEADPLLADGDYSRVGAGIRHHVKSLIGVTCDVVLKNPGELPRSLGKAVRVKDLRNV